MKERSILLFMLFVSAFYSCIPEKKSEVSTYKKFRKLFPQRQFPVSFNSDSIIKTEGLYRFEPSDTMWKRHLPGSINENGGYSYGKLILKDGETVYIGLVSGDGLNPVFFTLNPDGNLWDDVHAYSTPGHDKGFYSVEIVKLFEKGLLQKSDSTSTWQTVSSGNPVDSAIEGETKLSSWRLVGGSFIIEQPE